MGGTLNHPRSVHAAHDVDLTDELHRFVLSRIESGRYENAGEVVFAGILALEREEREHDTKLTDLRNAIYQGDASGFVVGNPIPRVRVALKRPNPRL